MTPAQVIIVGRTEETLAKTSKEIGATAYYKLDTGDIPSIESFVKETIKKHPELDCLVGQSGFTQKGAKRCTE